MLSFLGHLWQLWSRARNDPVMPRQRAKCTTKLQTRGLHQPRNFARRYLRLESIPTVATASLPVLSRRKSRSHVRYSTPSAQLFLTSFRREVRRTVSARQEPPQK